MKAFAFTLMATVALAGMVSAGSCGGGDHSQAAKTKAVEAAAKMESMNIVQTAVAAEGFSTLVAAVKAAGLVEALSGEGPFTVFAPTDEAFAELPEGTLEALLKDKDKLTSILTYHVVEGAVMSEQVVKLDKAQTLNGQEVTIATKDDYVMVDGANVMAADIVCSNGIIHVIDKVILPKTEN